MKDEGGRMKAKRSSDSSYFISSFILPPSSFLSPLASNDLLCAARAIYAESLGFTVLDFRLIHLRFREK